MRAVYRAWMRRPTQSPGVPAGVTLVAFNTARERPPAHDGFSVDAGELAVTGARAGGGVPGRRCGRGIGGDAADAAAPGDIVGDRAAPQAAGRSAGGGAPRLGERRVGEEGRSR